MTRTVDEIAEQIHAHKAAGCEFAICRDCTQMVPGEGSPGARVMFIGEAPGKREDAAGHPFIGAAGRLLDALLESVGMDRDDVFITNVLKARPPGNRDPRPDEAAHHWPWLEAQIAALDPAVIVLLGRHAMQRFFTELKISEVHGQQLEHEGRTFLPLYHPAAALYDGRLRQTVFADFAQLAGLAPSGA